MPITITGIILKHYCPVGWVRTGIGYIKVVGGLPFLLFAHAYDNLWRVADIHFYGMPLTLNVTDSAGVGGFFNVTKVKEDRRYETNNETPSLITLKAF